MAPGENEFDTSGLGSRGDGTDIVGEEHGRCY